MMAYTIPHFMPLSWFVDIKSTNYADVCVGSNIQSVTSERYVRLWSFKGQVFAQIAKIENQQMNETTITRDTLFAYEKDSGFVQYDIRYNEPFETVGTYTVQSYIIAYPLVPFITISDTTPYGEHVFNVVECNI